MKKIIFEKQGMKNFCNHIDPIELEFGIGKLLMITGPNGCLSGDTEIDLPRNLSTGTSEVKIKDLIDKEIYTYSYNIEEKKLELKKAFEIRRTGINTEVWKLEFEGGSRKGFKNYNYLVATPDHRVLKSDGIYCQLKDLKVGDSLMSLYRRSFDGYTHIKATDDDEYYEHRFIGESLFGYHEVFHHKDLKRFNNDIENIEGMTEFEHKSLHAELLHDDSKFMWKDHPKGMKGKNHTKNTKRKISNKVKEFWNDTNRKNQSDIMKRIFSNMTDIEKAERVKNISNTIDSKKNRTGDFRNKDILYNLYINQGYTKTELSKIFNCHVTTILYYLKKYNIKRDNHIVTKVSFHGYEDVYNMNVIDNHNFVANGIFVANSGKTSLIQALPYTLYGSCEKGRGEEVLNNKIKKNCHTWTEFTVINGDIIDNYRVDRYVKYTKKGNTVILKKNGVEISKGHKEVVPMIEKIILPYKLFTNTLLFGQKVKTFFTDLGDAEQKEIFRKILKLDDYVLYQKTANIKLKEIVKLLETILRDVAINNGIIDSGKNEIKRLLLEKEKFYQLKEIQLKEMKENIVPYKIELKLKIEESDYYAKLNLTDELSKIDNDLGSSSSRLNSMDNELESKKNEIISQSRLKTSELEKGAGEAVAELSADTLTKKDIITKKYSELMNNIEQEFSNRLRKEDELNSKARLISANISSLEQRKTDYIIDPDITECPTCHQDINEECIELLQLKISEIDASISKLNIEYDNTINEANNISESAKELKQKSNDVKKEYNSELYELNDTYEKGAVLINERLTTKLTQLKDLVDNSITNVTQSNIAERIVLKGQIEELKSKRESLVNKINEYNEIKEKVNQIQLNISRLNNLIESKISEEYNESPIDSIKNKEKELIEKNIILKQSEEEYTERVEMLKFWNSGFSSSGIQSMLIDDSIPFMNEKISEYMDKLSNGRYSVSFDTMKAIKDGEFRDKISVEVFDNQTHADTRTKISGGQERIVDIGTILTLGDLQSKIQDIDFNILLFDEIFDSLDDENVGFASNLLRQVSRDKWIGIISHRHIDSVESDEILSFR